MPSRLPFYFHFVYKSIFDFWLCIVLRGLVSCGVLTFEPFFPRTFFFFSFFFDCLPVVCVLVFVCSLCENCYYFKTTGKTEATSDSNELLIERKGRSRESTTTTTPTPKKKHTKTVNLLAAAACFDFMMTLCGDRLVAQTVSTNATLCLFHSRCLCLTVITPKLTNKRTHSHFFSVGLIRRLRFFFLTIFTIPLIMLLFNGSSKENEKKNVYVFPCESFALFLFLFSAIYWIPFKNQAIKECNMISRNGCIIIIMSLWTIEIADAFLFAWNITIDRLHAHIKNGERKSAVAEATHTHIFAKIFSLCRCLLHGFVCWLLRFAYTKNRWQNFLFRRPICITFPHTLCVFGRFIWVTCAPENILIPQKIHFALDDDDDEEFNCIKFEANVIFLTQMIYLC